MFGSDREAGIEHVAVDGQAPIDPGPQGFPPGTPINTAPRLRSLRRAAAVDMIDQVGLAVVPGQLWPYVDAATDPGVGIARFLRSLGLDAALIRARDRAECERSNDLFELLLGIDDAFDHLAPDVVRAIEARLWSGDYEEVRQAAEAVDVLGRITRLERRWPDARLAILSAFLADVRASLADPLTVDAADLAAAQTHAETLTALALAVDEAVAAHQAVREALVAAWPPVWSGGDEEQQADCVAGEFDILVEALLADVTIDAAGVAEIVAKLEGINAELSALLARAEDLAAGRDRRSGAGAGARSSAAGMAGPLAEALAFFGLALSPLPNLAAVKKRFRELARRYHSDLTGGDDRMMKTLNGHYDTLKARCPA